MAGVTRAARRRAEREQHRLAGVYIAAHVGWCQSEADLPGVRTQLHDALIAELGRERRSGVTWFSFTGEEANARLTELQDGRIDDTYRRIRALLREHGGWLVVAMCDARRAPGDS